MENLSFHPTASDTNTDAVASSLRRIAHVVLIFTIGLFPILFVPLADVPFNFSKTLFVIAGIVIAVIFYTLSVLRDGTVSITVPAVLAAFWGIAVVYVVSTVFSGDLKDSFAGDTLGAQTTAFMLLMAVVASMMLVFRGSQSGILRLYSVLFASALILGVFHVLRVMFGADFLAFGMFDTVTSSPFGSWNGMAIFFGLIALLALLALEQLPLRSLARLGLVAVVALALCMLAVVNFFIIWVVLAVVSIVTLIYTLVRKHYPHTETLHSVSDTQAVLPVIVAAIMFVVSMVFIIGGSTLGTMISSVTGISNIEVRPSHTATFEILKDVYATNPVTGIGPNRFVDAWRLHKNPAINETLFWDTQFDAGSGFVPTSFVTTGLLGVVAWLTFFFLLGLSGLRMFFRRGQQTDVLWAFVGTSSFMASAYLWFMSMVYTPAVPIMLLTAVCTGLFLAAYVTLLPHREFGFGFGNGRASGLALVAATVLVLVGSIGAFYAAGQQYASLYIYAQAPQSVTSDTIDTMNTRVADAFDRSANDVYVRFVAQVRALQLQSLLATELSGEFEQARFQEIVTSAINAAQLATETDPTEPANWIVLGQIYSMLTLAGVDGAYDRAVEAYETARTYDPQNPYIVLAQAQLEARNNDLARAREVANVAVSMKRNYTEAIFFLAQLDILEDNVPAAIARTEAVTQIEPNNPARHYQLGILYASAENNERAIVAFERAIALDPQYANARYFLAAAYSEAGRFAEAMQQMRIVEEMNPGNDVVKDAIANLEAGRTVTAVTPSQQPAEQAVVDGQTVTPETVGETSLVAPVNTVPDEATVDTTGTDE